MQAAKTIETLIAVMAALRHPETGCGWDLQQTHRSLAPYALEEAYEVVEAIEHGSAAELRDELGDLLLQVVFHARLAEEAGTFDFGDVVEAISAKMIRRHPHIFAPRPEGGQARAGRGEGAKTTWEAVKAAERKAKGLAEPDGLLSEVALALPGLARALKLQQKAATVGFDWDDVGMVLAKIREETVEVEEAMSEGATPERLADEVGDLLFAVANLARHLKIDPEAAIRSTNTKFERRFAFIEGALHAAGTTPQAATLDEMDALWSEAKRRGL